MRARLAAGVSAGLAFGLMASFSHPAPDWLDGPEFMSAAARGGLFHAPGAPLAVLTGRVFGLWPGAILSFSAVWAALTVYLLARIFQKFGATLGKTKGLANWLSASLMALAVGLGPGLFSQSLRIEVYCLGPVLALAGLRELIELCINEGQDDEERDRRTDRLCALIGMGAAVHPLQALGLVPGLVVLIAHPNTRRAWLRPGQWMRRAAHGLLGFGPVLLLPLMVHDWVDLRWADPTSFGGFVHMLLGLTYIPTFSGQAAEATHTGGHGLLVIAQGIGLPLLAVAAMGAYLLARTRLRLLFVLLGVIGVGVASLVLQHRLRLDNPDATGYGLPAICAIAALAAAGLFNLGRHLQAAYKILYWIPLIGALSMAANSAISTLPGADRSECRAGRSLAEQSLRSLPEASLLILADFNMLFMFEYLTRVEGLRPDLTVLYLADLDNRPLRCALAKSRPDLEARLPSLDGLAAGHIRRLSAKKPVFIDAGPHMSEALLKHAQPHGLLWRLGSPAPDPAAPLLPDPITPTCGDGQAPDSRTAQVLCWHGWWNHVSGVARNLPARATRALWLAACACPKEDRITAALSRHEPQAEQSCGSLPNHNHSSQPQNRPNSALAPALLLLLGMGLWLTGTLAGVPRLRREFLQLITGCSGLALMALSLLI